MDEEIRSSLWAMKPFKAPSPDGLHMGFFQLFWIEAGKSVYTEVKRVFTLGVVSKYLNETLIALVPKY